MFIGAMMPTIKSSTELRSHYNDISLFCHQNEEPVFVTMNGEGDLAVMSIEYYERLLARNELYALLSQGAADIHANKRQPYRKAIQSIRKDLTSETI
jgi:PHD/YefM family antitoxin component YafN of YafNO toxin-antitoxin module